MRFVLSLTKIFFWDNINGLADQNCLNPISAGVLENQDMLGGGVNLTPPLNPMFDMTNDTSFESSCALLLESAKKIKIC